MSLINKIYMTVASCDLIKDRELRDGMLKLLGEVIDNCSPEIVDQVCHDLSKVALVQLQKEGHAFATLADVVVERVKVISSMIAAERLKQGEQVFFPVRLPSEGALA